MSVLRQLEFELGLAAAGIHINQDDGLCGIILNNTPQEDHKVVRGWYHNVFLDWEFATGSRGFPIPSTCSKLTSMEMFDHVSGAWVREDVTCEEEDQYRTKRRLLAQTLLSDIGTLYEAFRCY